MIKQTICLLGLMAGVASVLAQTTPVQPAQTLSYPGSANTNQLGLGGLTFSNDSGQTFTPEQLASQLQNLRTVIDQTLPVLSAFNEHYSNSITGGKQTIGGALSGIVSDVLHRNQASGQNSTAGQSSFSATNLLAALHGLLNTNSTGAVGASPSNAQDLIALQNELQPVEQILQRLNVSATPTQNITSYSQPYPQGNISPTGR